MPQRHVYTVDLALRRASNHSDVTWELILAPGETRTLTYGLSLYE